MWGSLESLIEEMADCCIKVYTLEKVLRVKRDPVTDVVFLDEALKVSLECSDSGWGDSAERVDRSWRTSQVQHSGLHLGGRWRNMRAMLQKVCRTLNRKPTIADA